MSAARLVMFTALGLLGVATAASAESAWVLWVRESQLSGEEINPARRSSLR